MVHVNSEGLHSKASNQGTCRSADLLLVVHASSLQHLSSNGHSGVDRIANDIQNGLQAAQTIPS